MEWTETWVRGLTGWQAFREGKSLFERGSARDFKQRGKLLSAAFGAGRRTWRTVVRGEEALEVECGCAENRATGAVCAHGVALLLTAIAEQSRAEPEPELEAPRTEGRLLATRLVLPKGFAEMLGRGKLRVKVEETSEVPVQADAVFSLWLARHSAGAEFPQWLALDDRMMADFLEALADHPRVRTEEGLPVTVRSDRLPPLELSTSELRGDRVRLRRKDGSPAEISAVRWGASLGMLVKQAGEIHLGRAPVGEGTPAWRDQAADLIDEGWIDLSREDFLDHLDDWLDLFASPLPGWLGEARFEAAPIEVVLELEGSLNALDAVARFRYDGSDLHPLGTRAERIKGLPLVGADGLIRMRDPAAEREAAARLIKAGFIAGALSGEFKLRDGDAILAFVADDLPELRKLWTVAEGQRFRHVLASVHVVRARFHEPSSLALDLSFQTDAGKQVPRAKIQEILRAGKRSATTANGAKVVIAREIPDVIEPLMADLGILRPEDRIRLDRARDLIFRELRSKTDKALVDRTEEGSDAVAVPAHLETLLRDYQVLGFRWLVDRLESLHGALLADEMGLGKTIQTIAAIEHFRPASKGTPSLVLVPATLIGNWQDELARFGPGLRVVTLHGQGRDARRDEVGEADVVLTSFGTLVRDLAFHLRQKYGLLVVDEASLLRNPDSEISRSVTKLEVARRLALTGTPVENRIQDLWSIFRMVAPGYLGARKEFVERYDPSFAAEAGPGLHQRLRLRISPYVLRRTKAEVAKDLPEKLVIDDWLDFPPEDRAIYAGLARSALESLESEGREKGAIHILTQLLRLRQFCLEPALIDPDSNGEIRGVKSKRLMELLEERASDGKKTLVFSQFRQYLRMVHNQDSDRIGKGFLLDGSTRDRSGLVRDFQQWDGPAVFFISLKAGGYGLNLTAADAVVHMDPWWNPAAEAQASDRVHRIGQTAPVTIHRLLMRDSVEERVRRLQLSKQAVIDALHDGDGSIPANWTESDLRGLIG